MAKQAKRMTRKELNAPDEVAVKLEETWEKVFAYRKPLVAGVLILVGLGVAGTVFNQMSASSAAERAEAMREALAPLTAPVGPEPEDAQPTGLPENTRVVEERFDTRAAAGQEAAARLEALQSGSAAVSLATAHAKLRGGDAAGAVASYEAWLGEHGETPLAVGATMGLARAQGEAGQLEAAVATYQKIAESNDGLMKAIALTAVGDLLNPIMRSEGGDKDGARTAYKAARDILGDPPEAEIGDYFAQYNVPYLLTELDNKLFLLER